MVDTDVLVVGGGISGLATAWQLSRSGVHTTLWERRAYAGGKIRTDNTNGYLLEQGATMVMNFSPEVDDFIHKTGLDNIKIRRDTRAEDKRYVLQHNRLITVPTSLHKVPFSKAWSLTGKLRMMIEPMIRKGGGETETVSEFTRRRLGHEMLEKTMEPFISGILASDPDQANAYTVIPRLVALERRYGSIARGVIVNKLRRRRTAMAAEVFSFRGGMVSLVNHLTDSLCLHGNACFNSQVSVTRIERKKDGWTIHADSPGNQQTISANHLVLCTPAATSASLVRELDHELSDLLSGIQYTQISVVHLGFDRAAVKHPLNGSGFLVGRQEGLGITGNLWMSTVFPDCAPIGKVLLTSYLGGSRRPESVDWSDERSVATVLGDLGSILGIKADPDMVNVNRVTQALPLYHGSYYRRCSTIRRRVAQLPGLHLQANYLGGIAVRDRLTTSNATATQIMRQMGCKDEPDPTEPGAVTDIPLSFHHTE